MVKNIVTISLTIFITTLVVVLGAAVLQNQNMPATVNSILNSSQSSSQTAIKTINGNTSSVGPISSAVSSSSASFSGITAAQISAHNNINDCWVIVSGKVYNVTNFIPMHSGGANTIIPYCGKDATTAFDTKNGRGSHSQRAQNALQTYYVGNLGR
jgi:cytochrome b involved in lipid metabolism